MTESLDQLARLHKAIHDKRNELVPLAENRTPENERKITAKLKEINALTAQVKQLRAQSLGPHSRESALNLDQQVESYEGLEEE